MKQDNKDSYQKDGQFFFFLNAILPNLPTLTLSHRVHKTGNNNPVYETAKETLMYRTVLWTIFY